jgi:hypothetical protein
MESEVKDIKSHWNRVYEKKKADTLGWYEDYPAPCLNLIRGCNLDKSARILSVGVGTSKLIDNLIGLGYHNLIASDISLSAMNVLKDRLGRQGDKVTWILDDITNPTELDRIGPVDLWHDRAVLHFITDEKQRSAYFELINKMVKPGGFAIIAAFNLQGAEMCSGLPVYRYSKEMLEERMKGNLKLLDAFDYTYTMPSGNTREYVYTLFGK